MDNRCSTPGTPIFAGCPDCVDKIAGAGKYEACAHK
jgi:hypothetical protein